MHQNSNKKGFLVILILLVVIILAGLGSAGWHALTKHRAPNSRSQSRAIMPKQKTTQEPGITTQTDPYEGWLTYTNPTYEVSFRYPADWKVEEASIDNPPSSATRQTFAINVRRRANVAYSDTIGIEILDEALDKASSWYESGSGASYTKIITNIKGKPSVQFLSSNDLNSKVYLFGVGSRTYSFSSINEGTNIEADSAYWSKFANVFSSFQITQQ